MRFLVTGTAGFIGFHLARRLLDDGHQVVGIDGFTPYYDVSLKESRNAQLIARDGFAVHRIMLEDKQRLAEIWHEANPDVVVHLAAQAGVRYGIENPRSYIDANIEGTFNLLEAARASPVRHLLIASTSSVYGANTEMPFRETDRAVHPLSLYAATKLATEHIAHSYSHLWGLPVTAFRFFTVYGPWGRPDMALFKFTRGIIEGTPIDVYNHGLMERDFTYIDDLVESVSRLIDLPPATPTGRQPGLRTSADGLLSPAAPFRVVNVGGGHPTSLVAFIEEIERAVGRPSQRNLMEIQPGDVVRTFASADGLEALIGYRPSTPIGVGVKAFVDWYRDYYKA
jgi:UDP-glucuronate 4-epimerase